MNRRALIQSVAIRLPLTRGVREIRAGLLIATTPVNINVTSHHSPAAPPSDIGARGSAMCLRRGASGTINSEPRPLPDHLAAMLAP